MTVLETIGVEMGRISGTYARMSREDRKRYREYIRYLYENGIDCIMQNAGYIYHHTAIHPGGIRKRNPVSAEVHPYDGRFGIGYTVHRYKGGSDNSHYVDYWIKRNNNDDKRSHVQVCY